MLFIDWVCVYNLIFQLKIYRYFKTLATESSFFSNFVSKNSHLNQESGENNCFNCVSFVISFLLTIVKFKTLNHICILNPTTIDLISGFTTDCC